MANRRQGHGGGRPYYNNGPVNPWQGGNVPGGNAAGGAFNSASPSNLLSQLTEPQAQLALALTKLLQPQQQVPSLLTMDTVNPLHNRGGYGPNKNNYPQRSRADIIRRVRHDFKRNEPYNKIHNRNVRDTEFKRRRGNSNKSDDRKIQAHRSTTVVASNKNIKTPSAKVSAKPDKSNEVKPVDDDNPEPTPSAADTVDTSVVVKDTSDIKSEDESKDEKRDWKEEKSSEEVAETSAIESTEVCKEEDVKEKADVPVVEKKPENDRYAGIPAELLHCLICQKSMWDGESFDKHMNGRAHQQMFEKVEESYKIKADMMREAIRLAEEKNNIEMDRMKRLGKKTKAQQRSRCAMCDLEFYGQLFVHRKSASHQKLKHFLHPRCNYCNKEFPTRMEWENHRHSPEHLRKKVEVDKKKDSIKDEDEILLEDECFIVIDSTDNDEQEDPNALTDLTDDLTDLQLRIPTYKANRAVGLSLIAPATGFFCKPCSRFFLTEEASQVHAQSRIHFNAFIKILNEKIAENEEKKRKTVCEDDEGNWKRRKVTKDDDDKNDNDGSLIEDEEHKEQEEEKKADTSELYDPADAFITNDPNDVCLNTDVIKQESVENENEEENVKTEPEEEEEEVKIKTEPPASPPKTTNVKNNIVARRTRAAKKNM